MNLFDIKPTMTYTYRLSKDDVIDMLKDKLKEQLGDVPLYGTLALEDDTIIITVSTEEPKQPKRRGPGRPRKSEVEAVSFDVDDYISELQMPTLLRDQEHLMAFETTNKQEALDALRKVGKEKVNGCIANTQYFCQLTDDEEWAMHYNAVAALGYGITYAWVSEPKTIYHDQPLGANRELVVSDSEGVLVRYAKLPNEKTPRVIYSRLEDINDPDFQLKD